MKKSLIATLVAASLLSPVAFAAEPVALNAAQMDGVTAGFLDDVNFADNLQAIEQNAVAINFGDDGVAVAVNVADQYSRIDQDIEHNY